MSIEFDVMYETVSPCCKHGLDWDWNPSELRFESECDCMKRYTLTPTTAEFAKDSEEFEDYDED